MAFRTLEELLQTLFQMQLIDPVVLQSCLVGLDLKENTPAELLSVLEQRHLLTPYQLGRLHKGDTASLVIGNYKLLYRNDSGSFARVFRAATLGTDEIIALKILRQRWLSDKDMVNHFHREAELCQKLRHPNIVPIYDVGIDDENHYFTMEFVEGGNLRDFLKIRKQLSPAEATGYVTQIARGLEYALRMGVTHRDMKLTNILLNTQGVAKLADFGLAGDSEAAIGTRGETPQHALEYATLEKATSVDRNDPRSDLFFLGVIYYELLAGLPPYQRTRNRDERKNILRYMNIKPIRTHIPDLPKEVVTVVEKLIKFDPQLRYQSASELVADLEELQVQIGVHQPPTAVARANQPNAESVNLSSGSSDSDSELAAAGVKKTFNNLKMICVETRPKFQSVLRDYFGKHGVRMLLMEDPGRALRRISNDPPDCILLMGNALGDDVIRAHNRAVELANDAEIPLITILSAKQAECRKKMSESTFVQILSSPLDLRDLRRALASLFGDIEEWRQEQQALKDSRLIR
ncbi:Serine/threonine-protein kinase PrkC [Polystyrenella longa]|uniref:Serine/threonine-protein kinase PrkC n=1 Tax=Polystyrenella longa TaxID=2528007 RepID=A0A518CS43_9PLAN|nr:serine/threonine-protein kinase [Polystyrenella longa]QDU82030.1 Serine/threonine-protein kinase PrkC [Polystyrenella longa]